MQIKDILEKFNNFCYTVFEFPQNLGGLPTRLCPRGPRNCQGSGAKGFEPALPQCDRVPLCSQFFFLNFQTR